jgi:hypothetical protein
MRFNWIVQQFEGGRCLEQWAGEYNVDSVLECKEWGFFFHGATAPSGLGPPLYPGFMVTHRHKE